MSWAAFSSGDAFSNNITFSNSNLTITSSSGLVHARSCIQLPGSPSLVYCSFTASVTGANGLGITNTTLPAAGTTLGADTNAVIYRSDGTVFTNNATATTLASYTAGDVIDMAIDQNHSKIWWRKNGGNWNNDVIGNQNPATNTGGYTYSVTGTLLFVAAQISATSGAWIANFGGSTFTYAAPAGFVPLTQGTTWDSVANANVTFTNLGYLGFSGNTAGGARCQQSLQTGDLVYFETDMTFTSGNPQVGAQNGSAGYTGLTNNANSIGMVNGASVAQVILNSSVQVSFGAKFNSGDTICVALDAAHAKIWFRINGGNWNNDVIGNQNPATNTGGISISGLSTPIYPAAYCDATTSSVTSRFGILPMKYQPPSGFTSIYHSFYGAAYNFTVPLTGCMVMPPMLSSPTPSISPDCFGAGGGTFSGTGAAASGEGGGYAITFLTPASGDLIYFSIGAGGLGNNASQSNGGDTWINKNTNSAPVSSTTGTLAKGGVGASARGTAGTVRTTSGQIGGSATFNGGAGANAQSGSGSRGGSSGGNSGATNAAGNAGIAGVGSAAGVRPTSQAANGSGQGAIGGAGAGGAGGTAGTPGAGGGGGGSSSGVGSAGGAGSIRWVTSYWFALTTSGTPITLDCVFRTEEQQAVNITPPERVEMIGLINETQAFRTEELIGGRRDFNSVIEELQKVNYSDQQPIDQHGLINYTQPERVEWYGTGIGVTNAFRTEELQAERRDSSFVIEELLALNYTEPARIEELQSVNYTDPERVEYSGTGIGVTSAFRLEELQALNYTDQQPVEQHGLINVTSTQRIEELQTTKITYSQRIEELESTSVNATHRVEELQGTQVTQAQRTEELQSVNYTEPQRIEWIGLINYTEQQNIEWRGTGISLTSNFRIEELSLERRDTTFVTEVLQSENVTPVSRIEILAGVNVTRPEFVEWKQAEFRDTPQNIEWRGTGIGVTSAFRIEELATLNYNSAFRTEILHGVNYTDVEPLDWKGTLQALHDVNMPLEWRAPVSTNATHVVEELSSLNITASWRIEILRAINLTVTERLELLRAVHYDELQPAEWRGTLIAIRNTNMPLEWIGAIRVDKSSPSETTGNITQSRTSPLEGLSITREGWSPPLEFLAALARASGLPADIAAIIERASLLPADTSANVLSDTLAELETLSSIVVDYPQAVEWYESTKRIIRRRMAVIMRGIIR